MKYEEQALQISLIQWFRTQYPQLSKLITLGSFGENVGVRRMKDMKRMGLTSGYPDLVLYLPKIYKRADYQIINNVTVYDEDVYYGLMLELKTLKGRVSDAQHEVMQLLKSRGYLVNVARSFEEGKQILSDYVSQEDL